MNFESFKKKFHPSWHNEIKHFIESSQCDDIFKVLKERSGDNAKIAPTSYNTFKAFEIPLDSINVVVVGNRPYNGFVDSIPVANGLYLDCSNIEKSSYELKNFYRGIELEIYNGLNLEYYPDTYNTKFLKDQGVMMMTAALTVEQFEDHDQLWFYFTSYVMGIFKRLDVPVILVGDNAIPYASFLKEDNVYRVDAPKGVISEWDTKNVFTEVNRALDSKGKDTIMWLNIDCPF